MANLAVTTDKTSYTAGQTIDVTVSVTNLDPGGSSSKAAHVVVTLSDGTVLSGDSPNFAVTRAAQTVSSTAVTASGQTFASAGNGHYTSVAAV